MCHRWNVAKHAQTCDFILDCGINYTCWSLMNHSSCAICATLQKRWNLELPEKNKNSESIQLTGLKKTKRLEPFEGHSTVFTSALQLAYTGWKLSCDARKSFKNIGRCVHFTWAQCHQTVIKVCSRIFRLSCTSHLSVPYFPSACIIPLY